MPDGTIALLVTALSLAFLAVLGAVGAKAGGTPILSAEIRVTFWGTVAMAVTALVGKMFGAVVQGQIRLAPRKRPGHCPGLGQRFGLARLSSGCCP